VKKKNVENARRRWTQIAARRDAARRAERNERAARFEK